MKTVATLLAGVAALFIANAAGAQEKIAVVMPALLDPNAPIGEAVRRECGVQTSVGTQVFERVSERFPGTVQVQEASQAGQDTAVLKVTLIGVLGAGGGGWSGQKSITLRAEILQGAKVVMARTLSRQSGGGVFGGVSGTCAIMERIAVALGRDVAGWLPSALTMVRMELPPAPKLQAAPKQ